MRTLLIALGLILAAAPLFADPLPSWNDTATKARIMDFVSGVTDPVSDDYVPPEARISVFDNDGTLWAEQPVYFQVFFALDALRDRAAADPSILTSDTLRAAVAGDMDAVKAAGTAGLAEIVAASHADMTVAGFQENVRTWIGTAKHPETGMRFADMTYQPMTELISFLRDEGFETWIVTGGGVHFVRALSEDAYGIPPEQVIGSVADSEYRVINGVGEIYKLPGIAFVDDKGGKAVGIDRSIGRRPILAFGNSDGDYEMLEYVTTGGGPRLGLLLHHTDAAREWAYDRDGHVGALKRGLEDADAQGWLVVDMATDWKDIWTAGSSP